jgi:hypothetical protein
MCVGTAIRDNWDSIFRAFRFRPDSPLLRRRLASALWAAGDHESGGSVGEAKKRRIVITLHSRMQSWNEIDPPHRVVYRVGQRFLLRRTSKRRDGPSPRSSGCIGCIILRHAEISRISTEVPRNVRPEISGCVFCALCPCRCSRRCGRLTQCEFEYSGKL